MFTQRDKVLNGACSHATYGRWVHLSTASGAQVTECMQICRKMHTFFRKQSKDIDGCLSVSIAAGWKGGFIQQLGTNSVLFSIETPHPHPLPPSTLPNWCQSSAFSSWEMEMRTLIRITRHRHISWIHSKPRTPILQTRPFMVCNTCNA